MAESFTARQRLIPVENKSGWIKSGSDVMLIGTLPSGGHSELGSLTLFAFSPTYHIKQWATIVMMLFTSYVNC